MASVNKVIGLIGYPLSHSFSNQYFTKKFKNFQLQDYQHINFEIEQISEIYSIIQKHPNLIGFNVTIPYKESIISYCSEISSEAQEIGAVNTVNVKRSDNKTRFYGYNTDAEGFTLTLDSWLGPNIRGALVIGSGGAAKAVIHSLRKRNIPYQIVSRNSDSGHIAYDELLPSLAHDFNLWINCTPLGMYPNIDRSPPLPYQEITPDHYLYDLIYNPAETIFLRNGSSRGATILNGLQMLHNQAEASWKIWIRE